jgi:GDP-4-dehydro-6-deoxy-D-mannose reductase
VRSLVTGAGGFCGSRLTALLRGQGRQVRSLGLGPAAPDHFHISSPLDGPGIRHALEAFQPDWLFHLAGTFDAGDPAVQESVNAGFAGAVFDALRALDLRTCRVLVFGSAAEYGPAPPERLPIGEDEPCAPDSAYGRTKLRQTELALAASAEGFPVAVLRPFNILGPGLSARLALGRFARQVAEIARGRQAPVVTTGDLSGTRDFIDVDDVAELAVELAAHPLAPGLIVNLCTGRETPVRHALHELLRLAGVDARIQEAAPPPGAGAATRNVGDPERLLGLVGPRAFRSLEHSLRAMLDRELGLGSNQN